MLQTKVALRKEFRDTRSKISVATREAAARAAVMHFSSQPIFIRSEHIACYLPFKDEFDSSPLIESIWNAKKHCYLPVLKEEEKTLIFVRYVYGDALRLNRHGILEPAKIAKVIAGDKLDLVITPLIAFDAAGHRLGTGGGYYDRTFAFMYEQANAKPFMLGLGYAAQETEQVPADPWDVTLKAVLTEQCYKEFVVEKA